MAQSSSTADTYDRHVHARMIDFFTMDGVPWPRRLWDIGSILALEELWEASAWAAQRVLSQAACDWQRAELRAVIGPDIGLGERELRKELNTLLGSAIPEPSPARRRLRELIDHARAGYTERWAAAVHQTESTKRPRPERLARTVAAHLLDLGYEATHLRRWAEAMNKAKATSAELVEAAAELARAPRKKFRVLVVLTATPKRELAEALDTWLTKGAVVAWLKDRGHDTTGLRASGGFIYEVTARDPYSAADQARQLLDRMIARSSFLRRSRDGIRPAENIWVDGHSEPIPVGAPARGADIMALVHEGHLYRVDARRRIDDALELAAPVNRGAVGPAVAGAWAAIESLLSHPDDPQEENERSGKAIAADRLAQIIACSWPRAELTALAHRHNPVVPDDLHTKLEGCTINRERAQLIGEAIIGDRGPELAARSRARYSDQAAVERMKSLLASPRTELQDAVRTFRITLRRLYRTRSIVLHGGSTQAIAMNAALRTAAPLVGAGLDRITHAVMTEGIEPLDLAARAELALHIVGGETGLTPVELLEPRGI